MAKDYLNYDMFGYISSLFFGLYYDFSHYIYIGIYISFDLNKAPRSCLATAGRAPEAVPFQTFKCMLHIFRRIFQKSLISYRDFHAISEQQPPFSYYLPVLKIKKAKWYLTLC